MCDGMRVDGTHETRGDGGSNPSPPLVVPGASRPRDCALWEDKLYVSSRNDSMYHAFLLNGTLSHSLMADQMPDNLEIVDDLIWVFIAFSSGLV